MLNLLLAAIDLFPNLLLVEINFTAVISVLPSYDCMCAVDCAHDNHSFAAGPMQLDRILTVDIVD